ncbi:hypothetical protein MPTK1_6g16960 [Marchantia polymorpha subsp. ruderalis]|uniref:Uncharacterized protein n=2 Tax=Marchantia polymorpha TaxID=3197 RepID=A0AAF6BSV9_MARPO|nr:hypothetical protein MARPO_0144s0018 [Marchantia polymorpha]BBN15093.1 hypothetical protein Mp_6g16960 [Marchantia polymorpha subsp. ruderalis]|eukprot:PTQ29299.1 hypothetical protein MARPO_0144s0018 [Marchantia polymorpha]
MVSPPTLVCGHCTARGVQRLSSLIKVPYGVDGCRGPGRSWPLTLAETGIPHHLLHNVGVKSAAFYSSTTLL